MWKQIDYKEFWQLKQSGLHHIIDCGALQGSGYWATFGENGKEYLKTEERPMNIAKSDDQFKYFKKGNIK